MLSVVSPSFCECFTGALRSCLVRVLVAEHDLPTLLSPRGPGARGLPLVLWPPESRQLELSAPIRPVHVERDEGHVMVSLGRECSLWGCSEELGEQQCGSTGTGGS